MLNFEHNMVNILYTIKGLIEVHIAHVQQGHFTEREEALSHAHRMMKKIHVQTDRALSITKRISLAMKDSENGHEALDRMSVKKIWGEVLQSLGRRHLLDHVEIVHLIPKKFPQILCCRRDFAEILYCLAENAVQAMSERGLSADGLMRGKLILRASLGLHHENTPLHLTLADTGPGIPKEMLPRIFEPFTTTKSLRKGNGLGLCLVRGLVRKNGGTISVASFKGLGTAFTLSFRAAPQKGEGAEGTEA